MLRNTRHRLPNFVLKVTQTSVQLLAMSSRAGLPAVRNVSYIIDLCTSCIEQHAKFTLQGPSGLLLLKLRSWFGIKCTWKGPKLHLFPLFRSRFFPGPVSCPSHDPTFHAVVIFRCFGPKIFSPRSDLLRNALKLFLLPCFVRTDRRPHFCGFAV